MTVPLHDRVGVDVVTRGAIEAAVAEHGTLDGVMQWARQCDPPRVIAKVVAQDEYCLDVAVRWDDALVLVYDVT
jgi:hypothetical protein